MNTNEQQLIQGLFDRLGEAERNAPPREAEAEAFIRERVARQPGAPYYMAQTIVVQEQALEAAQARIQELEAAPRQSSGGLFGSLFGGGSRERAPARPMGAPAGYGGGAQGGSPWNSGGMGRGAAPMAGGRMGGGGGGFLAGAAQTAVGVAGGMMLGSMLGGMFAGDEAVAGEMDPGAEAEPEAEMMDEGGDIGGFEDI